MTDFSRYAVYYLPTDAALAQFGAHWLGWDVVAGAAVEQPALDGIKGFTATPRKYGFHATLKPPFRLADGYCAEDLAQAVGDLAAHAAPVVLEGLDVSLIGRFLALVPVGDTAALEALAATIVRDLDPLRPPLSQAELARRRESRLSARQEALLLEWGYPYVLDQFRFHMTLTGRLTPEQIRPVQAWVEEKLPRIPRPYALNQIALVGEAADGAFHLIRRFDLGRGD